jgi:hypothetical protein
MFLVNSDLDSGCFAYLDADFLHYETQQTTLFFDAQLRQSGSSMVVVSTIRTILESLLTYHLPAEFALQSIDNTRKNEIESQYNGLIFSIDRWREVLSQQLAARGGVGVANEGVVVANLFLEVLKWARDYQVMFKGYELASGYVHQKLFVVMFHLGIIRRTTTVLDDYEGFNWESNNDKPSLAHDGPPLKQQSVLSAARFMSKLDLARICVCEGIALSVFFKGAHTVPDPYRQWRMAVIKERLKFHTLWDGFGLDPATQSRIVTYMEHTVIPDSVLERDSRMSHPSNTVDPNMLDPTYSHLNYVYENFTREILQFQKILKDPVRMEPNHRRQLVMWTERVWNRVCQPVPAHELRFRSKVFKEINKSIREITMELGRGAGPSAMEE